VAGYGFRLLRAPEDVPAQVQVLLDPERIDQVVEPVLEEEAQDLAVALDVAIGAAQKPDFLNEHELLLFLQNLLRSVLQFHTPSLGGIELQ